jgi:hypothetical protein
VQRTPYDAVYQQIDPRTGAKLGRARGRYAPFADHRRDIAGRLNTFLWAPNETTNETESSLGQPSYGIRQVFPLVRAGGQGQDRTVDLPLFRGPITPEAVISKGKNQASSPALMKVNGPTRSF